MGRRTQCGRSGEHNETLAAAGIRTPNGQARSLVCITDVFDENTIPVPICPPSLEPATDSLSHGTDRSGEVTHSLSHGTDCSGEVTNNLSHGTDCSGEVTNSLSHGTDCSGEVASKTSN
jgi:hypothetical protein